MWTMKSKYKIGDIVTVKEQYDNGCKEYDYPCAFTKDMLKTYGGKKLTIEEICYIGYVGALLTTEEYFYQVKENSYNWSDPMFQESELWKVSIRLVI